jgi:hypothetical protein
MPVNRTFLLDTIRTLSFGGDVAAWARCAATNSVRNLIAMRLFGVALVILASVAVQAQDSTAPRKTSARKMPQRSPVCAVGAICFSGEVFSGKEFRHSISRSIDFILEPEWTIAIVPNEAEGDCKEFASVVNAPYRAHRQLEIDATYGWTAQNEVDDSPREFYFVSNCLDYRVESERLNIVLWGYSHTEREYNEALAKLGSSRLGTGRLWITAFKITHSGDTSEDNTGKIQWMRFAVEIKLPK